MIVKKLLPTARNNLASMYWNLSMKRHPFIGSSFPIISILPNHFDPCPFLCIASPVAFESGMINRNHQSFYSGSATWSISGASEFWIRSASACRPAAHRPVFIMYVINEVFDDDIWNARRRDAPKSESRFRISSDRGPFCSQTPARTRRKSMHGY
jgi:hypothetical protein